MYVPTTPLPPSFPRRAFSLLAIFVLGSVCLSACLSACPLVYLSACPLVYPSAPSVSCFLRSIETTPYLTSCLPIPPTLLAHPTISISVPVFSPTSLQRGLFFFFFGVMGLELYVLLLLLLFHRPPTPRSSGCGRSTHGLTSTLLKGKRYNKNEDEDGDRNRGEGSEAEIDKDEFGFRFGFEFDVSESSSILLNASP